jgi:DSF synthase
MATDDSNTASSANNTSFIGIQFSEQLRATFDPDLGALWLRWNPQPRPCFNPPLLEACAAYAQFLQASCGLIEYDGQTHNVKSSVLSSDSPGVFNLGGDLDLFTKLIEERDRPGLLKYGVACVDAVYQNYMSYGLPITTVSLVQGECLGGGFEAALSSQVVIAERSARFGFPEIMFNLFPGMGAMSFVLRRSSTEIAEELTSSPTVLSAEEMLKKGIIDVVVEDGEGPAAVNDYLRYKEPAMRALFQVRKRVRPLQRRELDDIVRIWVDTALRINPRDLKLMGHLVARQDRLR